MKGESNVPSPKQKPAVLFVCTGNTCRSVMAQALGRRRWGKSVRVESAGFRPQPPEDAKNAIESLKYDFGIEASGHVPRSVKSLDLEAFDHVVALDKNIARDLRRLTKRDLIVWQIDNPWSDDLTLYKRCGLKLLQQLPTLPFPPDTA